MRSFAPLQENQPSVLILGSMPSQISLLKQQYYANPNNAFWWIVSQIWGFAETLDYSGRVTKLTQSGVAVWDVLADCIRPGSLDSNIEKASEIANNLNDFVLQQPSLNLIAFNGRAANQMFNRHCSELPSKFPRLRFVLLPSTSPAHAAMSKAQKLLVWRKTILDSTEWHLKSNEL